MTPAQLRAYAAVVRHGSARQAAAELGVSEAGISAHTSALRKELDDALYMRRGNELVFTPGGMRLATRAVELLGLQDQTRQEVADAAGGRRTLRLATTSLFAEYAAPGLIEIFNTRADDLEVEMSEHPSEHFAELLTSRQAHLVIGPSQIVSSLDGPSSEFLKYHLVVVVGHDHPMAGKTVRPQATRNQPWLLGPSALEERGATAQILRSFQVPAGQQQIFQSHAAALAEVQAGRGIGVVPEFGLHSPLIDGRLLPLRAAGAASVGTWAGATLPAGQAPDVARELLRFATTPRAIQAMLTGSGTNIGHFRPKVHVTLWS